MQHHFFANLHWNGGRNDSGTFEAEQLKTEISIPKEMDGPGIGTNPDEMLLGAASTCYIITLAAMIERANHKATLSLKSEGVVDVTNGVFTYKTIIYHLTMHMLDPCEAVKEKLVKLAHKAEQTCMISKAIRGNVEIQLQINFQ